MFSDVLIPMNSRHWESYGTGSLFIGTDSQILGQRIAKPIDNLVTAYEYLKIAKIKYKNFSSISTRI